MKCTHRSTSAPIARKRARAIAAASLMGVTLVATAKFARADTLYSFGLNEYGQLGDGQTGNGGASNSVSTPTLVNVLDGNVNASGVGGAHGLASDNGALYAWGLGYYGALGNGQAYSTSNLSSNSPVPAMLLTSGVTAVAGTEYSSAALANGALYTFGLNADGSLGNGSSAQSQTNIPTLTANPVLNSGVTAVAGGEFHVLAVQHSALYAWGFNGYGQIGLGYNSATTYITTPTLVPTMSSGVTSISAGVNHSLAVKNGAAYAWGYNQYGQLANNGNTGNGGAPQIYSTPAPVIGLPSGLPVSTVSAGGNNSYALIDGVAYAWGANDEGELGNGSVSPASTPNQTPTVVPGITGFITQLVGGFNSGYALTADGSFWSWGAQTYGQLGNGNISPGPSPSPTQMLPPTGDVFTSVVSSDNASEALVTVGIAPSSWAVDSSGNWNDNSNWTSGVPNGVDAGVALDAPPITAPRTITTTTPITIGNLSFDSASSYTIQGSGSITIKATPYASVSGAAINDYVGNHTLAPATLVFASNTNVTVSYGATLTLGAPTGSVLIDSNMAVTEIGYGIIFFNSTVSLQSGASLSLTTPTTINGLTLASNSSTAVAAHGFFSDNLLMLGSLSLSSTSELDLANNDSIVHNGNLASITSALATGYNGGAWNGSGIVSSTAAADSTHLTALGSLQAVSARTAGGQSLAAGDVLLKYTYYGDANLDGKVDGSDYSLIDSGFLTHATGWYNGDFNYDGVVNGSDYTLIDNAFNTQGAQLATEPATSTAELAGPFAAASVPEPATLGLLTIGLSSLLGRRRRIGC